jgi:hypothetical protein
VDQLDLFSKKDEEVVDVVRDDFIRLILGRDPADYDLYKDWSRKKKVPMPASPNFLMNAPHAGWCYRHLKFCPATQIWEVSWTEDFRRRRFHVMCFEGAEDLKRIRHVRKWQVHESLLVPGEEDSLKDNFCYHHYRFESTHIQTRAFTRDVVNSVAWSPMCDDAHEELVREGYHVDVWDPDPFVHPRESAVVPGRTDSGVLPEEHLAESIVPEEYHDKATTVAVEEV